MKSHHSSYFHILITGIVIETIVILAFYKFWWKPINNNNFYNYRRPALFKSGNKHNNDENLAKIAFEACQAPNNWFRHTFQKLVLKRSDDDDTKNWRDFNKHPIQIGGSDFTHGTRIRGCPIGCVHYPPEGKLAPNESGIYFDGSFVDRPESVINRRFMGLSILRTMESPVYRADADVEKARKEFDVVMTTSLDSDVPVPYFSWYDYEFMKPARDTNEKSNTTLSSGVFSNCDPRNFRQDAIDLISISKPHKNYRVADLFGVCSPEKKRFQGSKSDIIGRYKFHLAFENSNYDDYVTEKFFQSLVEGSVPVVIGAPNIANFAPSNNSFLVIEKVEEVPKITARMIDLANDAANYSAMLQWKRTGPSNQFKALIDLSIVHSSCRICMHLADRIRRQELLSKTSTTVNKCRCALDEERSVFRFYVRERGLFNYRHGYLFEWDLNFAGLMKAIITAFTSGATNYYRPIWTRQRDEKGHRPLSPLFSKKHRPQLNLYRIYDSTSTQGRVLFGKEAPIDSDEKIVRLFKRTNNCQYLEVIFV